jgi:hypothetical protein
MLDAAPRATTTMCRCATYNQNPCRGRLGEQDLPHQAIAATCTQTPQLQFNNVLLFGLGWATSPQACTNQPCVQTFYAQAPSTSRAQTALTRHKHQQPVSMETPFCYAKSPHFSMVSRRSMGKAPLLQPRARSKPRQRKIGKLPAATPPSGTLGWWSMGAPASDTSRPT